ncbi:MAG: hypothetical protein FWD18_01480 [Micrococcales bacterium]|nr:hypothetical protein [Micrococcales bacterium]
MPFEEYWALVHGSAEETERRNEQSLIELDEAIADCMADAGFEYYPRDLRGDGDAAEVSDSTSLDFQSAEFRRQYGYGIITISSDEAPGKSELFDTDINGAYRSSLSESAQVAYDRALNGMPHESDDGAFSAQGGCYNSAIDIVYGNDVGTSPRWAELLSAMNAVEEHVAESSEMALVNKEWSACMAGRSYPSFTSPADAEQSIRVAREGLTKPDATGLMHTDTEGLSRLKQAEIALAIADYECQTDVDYQPRLRAVTHQYQERFVAEHRAELEAWVLYETEQRSGR